MLSRVRGSLVAAVIGDCIGALFECSGTVTMDAVLKEVEQIELTHKKREIKGKKPELLPFTDDTAMARCITASIIDNKEVNINDIAKRFAEEFAKEPGRGYGGNVVTVLQSLADPNLKDLFQPAREQFNGTGSYGNGGSMRIAPLGLFYYHQSEKDLQEKAVKITELTHTHPHAIVGSLLQTFAVNLALSIDNSQPLDTSKFLDELLEQLRPMEKEIYHRKKLLDQRRVENGCESEDDGGLPFCDKLEVIRGFLTRSVDPEEVDRTLGTSISALGSVPTAVYCFLRTASQPVAGVEERSPVEQTILYAISLGGDTDTIATMAAAIAGAFYGLDSVPQAWQDSCEGVSDAKEFGEKMEALIRSRDKS